MKKIFRRIQTLDFDKESFVIKAFILIILAMIISLAYLLVTNPFEKSSDEELQKEVNYTPELKEEYKNESLDNLTLRIPETWEIKPIENEPSEESKDTIQLTKDDTLINLEFEETDITGIFCSNSVQVKELPNSWYRLKGKDEIRYSNRVSFDIKVTDAMAAKNGFNSIDDEWSFVADETYKVCYKDKGILLKDGKTVFKTPIISSDLDIKTIIEMDYIISSTSFIENVDNN